MREPRKILYSPGYGGGWTSWCSNQEIKKFMLTYQPIIDFLEAGGKFNSDECDESKVDKCHPVLKKFAEECRAKFGEVPFMGGADDLEVATVYGRVRIHEYDGNESYDEESVYDFEEWM